MCVHVSSVYVYCQVRVLHGSYVDTSSIIYDIILLLLLLGFKGLFDCIINSGGWGSLAHTKGLQFEWKVGS